MSTNTVYAIVISKAGSADNYFSIRTCASDNNYPVYYRAATGSTWSSFGGGAGGICAPIFEGQDGLPFHEKFGSTGWMHTYWSTDNERIEKTYLELSSSSGGEGIKLVATDSYTTGGKWYKCTTSTC